MQENLTSRSGLDTKCHRPLFVRITDTALNFSIERKREERFRLWGHQAQLLCLTSKMSHDHGRRDSCWLRLLMRQVHSVLLSLAGGVTDMVVGSGALLGVLASAGFNIAPSS